jgi:hypothetical protein
LPAAVAAIGSKLANASTSKILVRMFPPLARGRALNCTPVESASLR